MKEELYTQPSVFVIFGATGDLTGRKLGPALYNLYLDNWMPKDFQILGIALGELSEDDFREKLKNGVNEFSRNGKVEEKTWKEFAQHISYQSGDFLESDVYLDIQKKIENCGNEWQQETNSIFYLAVPPRFFSEISSRLAENKLMEDPNSSRVILEKPFGHDLETAVELNRQLCSLFDEKQIYRIDHYLGKEAVQNIMAFRFANSILEPLWNRNNIEHVQVSVTEQIGIENRGKYYENAGALRDMIQNHLLQLLCLVAMEPPVNFAAEEVRNRKVDVLRAIRRFEPDDIRNSAVRGQYAKGWMEGEKVKAYREEANVAEKSNRETFAAVKFFVDNWRWEGVPFYLRTGKRLHQRSSTITIQFKDVPHSIFPRKSSSSWEQNRLVISIQPEMSIRLQLQVKTPGLEMVFNNVDMLFNYKSTYSSGTPEAYETLLMDVLEGDQTLFMRADQVEAAWELLMPIINSWENNKNHEFPNYSAGTWGPEAAEALIARDGFHWFKLPLEK